ncbi:MAG: hypothetical protein ABH952_01580 [Candidatus Omnitrophota bacterium]
MNNLTRKIYFRLISIILINAFLCLDISWAAGGNLKGLHTHLAPELQIANSVTEHAFIISGEKMTPHAPATITTKQPTTESPIFLNRFRTLAYIAGITALAIFSVLVISNIIPLSTILYPLKQIIISLSSNIPHGYFNNPYVLLMITGVVYLFWQCINPKLTFAGIGGLKLPFSSLQDWGNPGEDTTKHFSNRNSYNSTTRAYIQDVINKLATYRDRASRTDNMAELGEFANRDEDTIATAMDLLTDALSAHSEDREITSDIKDILVKGFGVKAIRHLLDHGEKKQDVIIDILTEIAKKSEDNLQSAVTELSEQGLIYRGTRVTIASSVLGNIVERAFPHIREYVLQSSDLRIRRLLINILKERNEIRVVILIKEIFEQMTQEKFEKKEVFNETELDFLRTVIEVLNYFIRYLFVLYNRIQQDELSDRDRQFITEIANALKINPRAENQNNIIKQMVDKITDSLIILFFHSAYELANIRKELLKDYLVEIGRKEILGAHVIESCIKRMRTLIQQPNRYIINMNLTNLLLLGEEIIRGIGEPAEKLVTNALNDKTNPLYLRLRAVKNLLGDIGTEYAVQILGNILLEDDPIGSEYKSDCVTAIEAIYCKLKKEENATERLRKISLVILVGFIYHSNEFLKLFVRMVNDGLLTEEIYELALIAYTREIGLTTWQVVTDNLGQTRMGIATDRENIFYAFTSFEILASEPERVIPAPGNKSLHQRIESGLNKEWKNLPEHYKNGFIGHGTTLTYRKEEEADAQGFINATLRYYTHSQQIMLHKERYEGWLNNKNSLMIGKSTHGYLNIVYYIMPNGLIICAEGEFDPEKDILEQHRAGLALLEDEITQQTQKLQEEEQKALIQLTITKEASNSQQDGIRELISAEQIPATNIYDLLAYLFIKTITSQISYYNDRNRKAILTTQKMLQSGELVLKVNGLPRSVEDLEQTFNHGDNVEITAPDNNSSRRLPNGTTALSIDGLIMAIGFAGLFFGLPGAVIAAIGLIGLAIFGWGFKHSVNFSFARKVVLPLLTILAIGSQTILAPIGIAAPLNIVSLEPVGKSGLVQPTPADSLKLNELPQPVSLQENNGELQIALNEFHNLIETFQNSPLASKIDENTGSFIESTARKRAQEIDTAVIKLYNEYKAAGMLDDFIERRDGTEGAEHIGPALFLIKLVSPETYQILMTNNPPIRESNFDIVYGSRWNGTWGNPNIGLNFFTKRGIFEYAVTLVRLSHHVDNLPKNPMEFLIKHNPVTLIFNIARLVIPFFDINPETTEAFKNQADFIAKFGIMPPMGEEFFIDSFTVREGYARVKQWNNFISDCMVIPGLGIILTLIYIAYEVKKWISRKIIFPANISGLLHRRRKATNVAFMHPTGWRALNKSPSHENRLGTLIRRLVAWFGNKPKISIVLLAASIGTLMRALGYFPSQPEFSAASMLQSGMGGGTAGLIAAFSLGMASILPRENSSQERDGEFFAFELGADVEKVILEVDRCKEQGEDEEAIEMFLKAEIKRLGEKWRKIINQNINDQQFRDAATKVIDVLLSRKDTDEPYNELQEFIMYLTTLFDNTTRVRNFLNEAYPENAQKWEKEAVVFLGRHDDNAWVIFFDISELRGRNDVYGWENVNILAINTLIEAARKEIEERGRTVYHVSGDEVVGLLPPMLPKEVIEHFLVQIQRKVIERIEGKYVFAILKNINDSNRDALIEKLRENKKRNITTVTKSVFLTPEEEKASKETFILFTKDVEEDENTVLSEILANLKCLDIDINGKIYFPVYVPFAPVGAVKISDIPNISQMSLLEQLRIARDEAEYTQRRTKYANKLVGIGLSERPDPEREERKSPIKIADDKKFQLGVEGERIRQEMIDAGISKEDLDKFYPVIERDKLGKTIQNILDGKSAVSISIVHERPDKFYLVIKRENNRVQLIKLSAHYIVSSTSININDFIRASGNREFYRETDLNGDAQFAQLHFGFKVINDVFGHNVGNDVILSINNNVYNQFAGAYREDDGIITSEKIAATLKAIEIKVNEVISELGMQVRLEAGVVHSEDLNGELGMIIQTVDDLTAARKLTTGFFPNVKNHREIKDNPVLLAKLQKETNDTSAHKDRRSQRVINAKDIATRANPANENVFAPDTLLEDIPSAGEITVPNIFIAEQAI